MTAVCMGQRAEHIGDAATQCRVCDEHVEEGRNRVAGYDGGRGQEMHTRKLPKPGPSGGCRRLKVRQAEEAACTKAPR